MNVNVSPPTNVMASGFDFGYQVDHGQPNAKLYYMLAADNGTDFDAAAIRNYGMG